MSKVAKSRVVNIQERLRRIDLQLKTAATGEMFQRTNSVDHPSPHLPRAGELAMGFPDNPYRKT